MTRSGLDTKNNEIDALIATFGYICLRLTYYPQPCRIETELLAMLRRLSPDPEAIANELRRLDATCETHSDQIHCVYERDVKTIAWIAEPSNSANVVNDRFHIDFFIERNRAPLEFKVNFLRNGNQ